jgi:hypothetical protein
MLDERHVVHVDLIFCATFVSDTAIFPSEYLCDISGSST